MRSPVPSRIARRYLTHQSARALLILANAVGIFVGLNFYLEQLRETSLAAWPFVMDSPIALALMSASLLTLAPLRTLEEYPDSLFLEILNTLAFVSLVKYAAWTAMVLHLFFSLYYPDVWSYFGILLTHLMMLFEAFLLPHVARTSRPALAVAAAWLIANDAADYLLGYHPHLRADQLGPVPYLTVGLTVASVALAAAVLPHRD